MHSFVKNVLLDLSQLVADSPGLASGLTRLAKRIGIELPLTCDPTYELLFPENWPQDDAAWVESLRDLADLWLEEGAESVAGVTKKLAWYEAESRRIHHDRYRMTPHLCERMAERASDPVVWLESLVDENLPGDLAEPFLRSVAQYRPAGWSQLVERCFASGGSLELIAVSVILKLNQPPADLLQDAVGRAAGMLQLVAGLGIRNDIPAQTLRRLLCHHDWRPAVAAAIGEWLADPRGKVRNELRSEWRNAVVRFQDERPITVPKSFDYWVGEIISQDPAMAYIWFKGCLKQDTLPVRPDEKSAFTKALACLDRQHRLSILKRLGSSSDSMFVLPRLVARDSTIYRELLRLDSLQPYHLRPLEGVPDQAWAELALLALAHGYEPRSIAASAFDVMGAVQPRDDPDYWRKWEEAFSELANHSDSLVKEIARHGLEIATKRIECVHSRLKREAMLGVIG
jgi:hypothetical protein